jgi:hypothetical protein
MCDYHLGIGDMFKTAGGLGIIVDKKNGKFHYRVVAPAAGTVKNTNETSRIPTTGFYESLDDGIVTDVYLVPKKYRRKRSGKGK